MFCRKKELKKKLVRITCFQGKVGLDKEQSLPGRGAYICHEARCIDKLDNPNKIKKLARALRFPLTRERVQLLERELQEFIKRGKHGEG